MVQQGYWMWLPFVPLETRTEKSSTLNPNLIMFMFMLILLTARMRFCTTKARYTYDIVYIRLGSVSEGDRSIDLYVRQKSKRYSSHGEARTLNLEITTIVKVSRASQLCHAGWNHDSGGVLKYIYVVICTCGRNHHLRKIVQSMACKASLTIQLNHHPRCHHNTPKFHRTCIVSR